jgi:hypothetical protein
MRITVALVLSIIIAVGLVAFGFTYFQISTERSTLLNELEVRTGQISEEILKGDSLLYGRVNAGNIENIADSLKTIYNLSGIAFYYSNDSIVTNSTSRGIVASSVSYIVQSIASGKYLGNVVRSGGRNIYRHITPVVGRVKSYNAILLFTDTEYIDRILSDIWFRNFVRWFVQAFLISLVTVIIIRW